MPTNIPEQVAKNRRDVQRLDGEFVSVPSRLQDSLRFLRNTFEVEVGLEVYKRPLGGGLVSGHPDGSTHGSGQGVSGDHRGSWQQVVSGASTHSWTREGRNAVRDALAGLPNGGLAGTSVGAGATEAQPTDDSLAAETGHTFASGIKDESNVTRARSHYLFSEDGDGQVDLQEWGLEDGEGRLMARATTSATVTTSSAEELRVDISATVRGTGAGNAVVTDDGEAAVADSIQNEGSTVGLAEIAWGTGSPTLDKSAASLGNEVFRKEASRNLGLESVQVSAPQFEPEPSGQPYDYTEAAVFDSEGRVVWVVGFDVRPKDEQARFTTNIGFRII